MLKSICYKGPLATDLSIPGERKSDGVIPAHGTGALRVSRNRWLLFLKSTIFHTGSLDCNGKTTSFKMGFARLPFAVVVWRLLDMT